MIAILLATYNGEKYISEQLESILAQTFQDYTIYIHDDGSTDNTIGIIGGYVEQYPKKIKLLEDSQRHRGPRYSFMWLLQQVDCDYYMFCDQDDVWLKDKIQLSLDKLRKLEENNPQKAALVHTEMKIVDENLNMISESLYATMRIKPSIVDTFRFMGVCSCGPGCTMIFNNKAKSLSLDYDNLDGIPMHDWWVAINTVKNGVVGFLKTPTMLYRQHSQNTVGSSIVNAGYMYKKAAHLKKTFQPYSQEITWLKKVGYGGIPKFLFFKVLFSILRMF